jgi:hypothetical protein
MFILLGEDERFQAKVGVEWVIGPAGRGILSSLQVDAHHNFVGRGKRGSSGEGRMISRWSVQDGTERARERMTGVALTRERPCGVRGTMVHAWYWAVAGNDRRDEWRTRRGRSLRFIQTDRGHRPTWVMGTDRLRWLRMGQHARPRHGRAGLRLKWQAFLARVEDQAKRFRIAGGRNYKGYLRSKIKGRVRNVLVDKRLASSST